MKNQNVLKLLRARFSEGTRKISKRAKEVFIHIHKTPLSEVCFIPVGHFLLSVLILSFGASLLIPYMNEGRQESWIITGVLAFTLYVLWNGHSSREVFKTKLKDSLPSDRVVFGMCFAISALYWVWHEEVLSSNLVLMLGFLLVTSIYLKTIKAGLALLIQGLIGLWLKAVAAFGLWVNPSNPLGGVIKAVSSIMVIIRVGKYLVGVFG